MDFEFSTEQNALRELAREILEAEVPQEELKRIEAADEWYSSTLWSKLAEANLLGLAVPEALGGMGFGILELCVLLQEVGRAVAPIPALPTLVLGGLPIARYGTQSQKQRWLAGVASGETVLSAALVDADSTEVATPATRARREGARWKLDGRKRFVPAADRAQRREAEDITDERGQHIDHRPLFEQFDRVGDEDVETTRIPRNFLDPVGARFVVIDVRQVIGPHGRPGAR